MSDESFKRFLIIISIIAGVLILAVFGFWGFDAYAKYNERKEINEAIDKAEEQVEEQKKTKITVNNNVDPNNIIIQSQTENPSITINMNETENEEIENNTGVIQKQTYKGFTLAGYIEIPSINLNPKRMPILEKYNSASSNVAPAINYGPRIK